MSASAFRALALAYAGLGFAMLRRDEEAEVAASEAVTIARGESDIGVLAYALTVKSRCFAGIGARRVFAEEALALGRSLPAGYFFEGLALVALSLAEFDAGDFASPGQKLYVTNFEGNSVSVFDTANLSAAPATPVAG